MRQAYTLFEIVGSLLVNEAEKHSEECERVSEDIKDTQNRMKEQRKNFDLLNR